MAIGNSSPYFRPSNISSISPYLPGSDETQAPPCCLAYVAGGGHDSTCRISGNAFHVSYEQPDGSTSITSTAILSAGSSTSTYENSTGFKEPFLPPPAYSAKPRKGEDIPFRELPPTYAQLTRADRFHFVRYLPGCARFAYPAACALSASELAAIGVHVGRPPARRRVE